MNQTIRYHWIDWAKAICILLMVCGHGGVSKNFHDLLYLFHLPVFFIITGFLFKKKDIKSLCKSLLLPVLFFNLINYPWYLYNLSKVGEYSLNNLVAQPLLGLICHDFNVGIPVCGPFWFVIVIFILRVIHQTTTQKWVHVLLAACGVIIAFASNGHPEKGLLFLPQRAAIAYPFFLFGRYLKNSSFLQQTDKHICLSMILSFTALSAFVMTLGTVDLYTCRLNIVPLYYLMGIIGFVFIYTISQKLSFLWNEPKWICHLSNGTLVILGLHNIVLFALKKMAGFQEFFMSGEFFSILTVCILYLPTVFVIKHMPILIGKVK